MEPNNGQTPEEEHALLTEESPSADDTNSLPSTILQRDTEQQVQTELKQQNEQDVLQTDQVADDLTVKLFVGQLPKTMSEEDVRKLFAPYGTILEVTILRDKPSGQHKGCAFVTYTTKLEADNAILAIHNKNTLPPAKNPVQVKYAEGELEKFEHKLFIGMIPKTATEDDLQKVFEPYGEIEELTILRGPGNISRGCAFVKYKHREHAMAAMSGAHGFRLPGSTTQGLNVQPADSDKAKQRKAKLKQVPAMPYAVPAYGYAPTAYSNPYYPPTVPAPQYAHSSPPSATSYAAPSYQPPSTQYRPSTANYAPPTSAYTTPSNASTYSPTSAYAPSTTAYTPTASAYPPTAYTNPSNPYQPRYGTPNAYPSYPSYAAPIQPTTRLVSSEPQVEGPSNCNLFIYNIPPNYSDQDLATAFAQFGNLLSAKVYIDKMTGLSKGFGFASYDTAEAAQTAITNMNGLQIGGKRLKVQLKRGTVRGQPGQPY